jgi:hypothetical protein
VTGAQPLGAAGAWHLVEELVYQQMIAHYDLVELAMFECELTASIAEALRRAGEAPAAPEVVAAGLVERAWERVGMRWRELRALRAELNGAAPARPVAARLAREVTTRREVA